MANVGVQATLLGLTRIAGDVDVPVEAKPSSSEIPFIPLPPCIGSLFGTENNDSHWYLLPTNSCVEETIISSVAKFGSPRTETEKEKVNARCLLDPMDKELQISFSYEGVIVGFVKTIHAPEVDMCVRIKRDGDRRKW